MSKRTSRRGGRGLFEIRPGQHKPKNIRNGAFFVLFSILLVYVLYLTPTVPGFGQKGQTVAFEVTDGINVRKASTPVRVKGVEVGSVTKVERAPSGRGVRVEVLVKEDSGVKVRKDAKIDLRYRTLLGRNIYVDLQPGSPSAPPLGDTVIAKENISVQTEVDNAIEPFDETGRKAVKTIIDEFDKGFGSAQGFQSTAKALGPAMKSLGPGLRSIRGTQAGDLQQAIRGTSRTFGALANSEVELGNLIDNGNVALGVTAARSTDLRAILSSAPPALRETRATMARLRTTLDVLDPVAKELRPGARALAPSADDAATLLTAATPLLRDAKPTVQALRPAVQDLTKLTSSGNAVMAAANPVLDAAVYPILPFLRAKGYRTDNKMYELVGPFASAITGVVARGDQFSTTANFEAGAGIASVPSISPCQIYLTDPTKTPEEAINCDAASRIVAAAITGVAPNDIDLRNPLAPQAKVKKLLADGSALETMVENLKRSPKNDKKEATR